MSLVIFILKIKIMKNVVYILSRKLWFSVLLKTLKTLHRYISD